MNKKAKTTIVILIVLVIIAFLLRTQLASRILGGEDFQITENPVVAFDNALAAESPVFIMFYSAF